MVSVYGDIAAQDDYTHPLGSETMTLPAPL